LPLPAQRAERKVVGPGLRSSEVVRRRIDRLLFLGPATALLVIFFVAPVLIDIGIAFSDMGRNLRVSQFTTGNVQRMLSGDFRLAGVLTTTFIYVLCTLAFFNVSYGLIWP
jgi:inositol-phosphate transport system permease protein